MPLIGNLLRMAAVELARNPDLRRKAGEVAVTAARTAKPLAQEAARQARPLAFQAGRAVGRVLDGLRQDDEPRPPRGTR